MTQITFVGKADTNSFPVEHEFANGGIGRDGRPAGANRHAPSDHAHNDQSDNYDYDDALHSITMAASMRADGTPVIDSHGPACKPAPSYSYRQAPAIPDLGLRAHDAGGAVAWPSRRMPSGRF